MSGRIRSIKPELLEDAATAGLSDAAFRLFVSMILMADDFGCLRAELALLRARVWWAKDPSQPIPETIVELNGLVLFYEVDGQRYASIRGWGKHQRIDNAGKRRVPSPTDEAAVVSTISDLETGVRGDSISMAPGSMTVGIGLYVSEACAHAGKSPVDSCAIHLRSGSFTKGALVGNVYALAHAALKNIAAFEASGGTYRPNLGLMTGEFVDA